LVKLGINYSTIVIYKIFAYLNFGHQSMKIFYFLLILLLGVSCVPKKTKEAPVKYIPTPPPRPGVVPGSKPKPKPQKTVSLPSTVKKAPKLPRPQEAEITLGDAVVENPK